MRIALPFALIFALTATSATAATLPVSYSQSAVISLGGSEKWDVVSYDPSSKLVYVAHGDEVTVVDPDKGTVVGRVASVASGTHGIAISTATGTGFTDDGKAGIALVFDLSTLKPVQQIATAPDADGIVFDAASGHVYVINGDSGSVTVIDPVKNVALSTIEVGGGLEFGVSDGHGKLYVNGAEKNEIVRFDTKSNQVDARWPIPACKDPHGLAIDTSTRRLFSTCLNNVMVVVDADNGATLATLPIGSYSDGAAFDPVRKLAFSSNGDGTLSIVREKNAHKFVSAGNVKTMQSARTMDIDSVTGRLFLVAADISKIDPPSKPGGRPHVEFVPGSLKLIVLKPSR
jgi:YVTN family beta-propeller protein